MHARLRNVVVAALILVVGVAGTATAAKTLITGKQIKDGSIEAKDLSKKARKALKGARGPAGATGAQGQAGPQGATGPNGAVGVNGADGQPGQSGSTAPALIFTSFALSHGMTFFGQPNGGSQGVIDSANVPVPPGVPLVARDFAAQSKMAPGAGQSFTITMMKNSVATALSCTISGTATSCVDPDNDTVGLAGGDVFSFRAQASAASTDTSGTASMRIVF